MDPRESKYEKQVIFDNPNCGYPHHQEVAKKNLTVGETYTQVCQVVSSWHTDVYLKGFPGVAFNSVLFSDVKKKRESLSVEELSAKDMKAIKDSVHPFTKLKISEVNAGHGITEYAIRLGNDRRFAEQVLKYIKET